jgi:hypothetical protein
LLVTATTSAVARGVIVNNVGAISPKG